MRCADFATSVILILASLLFMGASLCLVSETLTNGFSWYHSAGLLPAIVSVGLLVCAIKLCAVSIPKAFSQGCLYIYSHLLACGKQGLGSLWAFIWIATYILILIPLLPYVVATTIFLTFLTAMRTRKIFPAFCFSVIFSSALAFIFNNIVQIPLP